MYWHGKKILITAGPTREPIDPVRYISNYSTGKMGVELANYFAKEGAIVTLILGPSCIHTINDAINVIKIVTAAEMYAACTQYFSQNEVVVFAAAVADYTPRNPATQKIKKKEDTFAIELIKTKDIAYEMGLLKTAEQFTVGFALETNDEIKHAVEKLKKKKLDLIVLNSLNDKGAGFQSDTNKISIIDNTENCTIFDLKQKREVAKDIVDFIEKYRQK